ncbi:DNA topoisomerase I, putative [Babesia ovis]|uniref:DNA topoisomerase I, putative n=1 Tax=Babesia ovis TaxID=5869 RepID=A0A9W5WW96_BABOV|nr:DNA topoisomerase I, putative [Babesia ovis]
MMAACLPAIAICCLAAHGVTGNVTIKSLDELTLYEEFTMFYRIVNNDRSSHILESIEDEFRAVGLGSIARDTTTSIFNVNRMIQTHSIMFGGVTLFREMNTTNMNNEQKFVLLRELAESMDAKFKALKNFIDGRPKDDATLVYRLVELGIGKESDFASILLMDMIKSCSTDFTKEDSEFRKMRNNFELYEDKKQQKLEPVMETKSEEPDGLEDMAYIMENVLHSTVPKVATPANTKQQLPKEEANTLEPASAMVNTIATVFVCLLLSVAFQLPVA